jgi:hypothetical protein
MRRIIMAVALVLLLGTGPAQAQDRPTTTTACGPHSLIAAEFAPFSSRVWALERWRRGAPRPRTLRAYRHKLRCAAGPNHRRVMQNRWGRDRLRYGRHRHVQLRLADINRVWGPPIWAPDWSTPPGSQLPPYVIAALAEKTGDLLGIDVPGWTMAQMTQGESIRRPASAGVDPGGTIGVGLHAITTTFNDHHLARFGWSYMPDMWNPVRNTVIMALGYEENGLGGWYGNDYVTCWDCHYRGRFDLRLVLNGLTLRQAIPLR